MAVNTKKYSNMVKNMVKNTGKNKILSNLRYNGGTEQMVKDAAGKGARRGSNKIHKHLNKQYVKGNINKQQYDDYMKHGFESLKPLWDASKGDYGGSGKKAFKAASDAIGGGLLGNYVTAANTAGQYFTGGTKAETATRLSALGLGAGAIGGTAYGINKALSRDEEDVIS